MNDFVPLKIIYHLKSPVYHTGYGIHFDSLLSFIAIHVAGYFNPAQPMGWEPNNKSMPSLPLAKMHYRDKNGKYYWWYRASKYDPKGVISRQYWAKKFDRVNTDVLDLGRATKIGTSCGTNKDYFVPVEAISQSKAVFYVVGNFARVRTLARRIKYIGKKASSGYGVVKDFEMDRIDCDLESFALDWRTPDNKPARNLPFGYAQDMHLDAPAMSIAPILPPYWRIREENVTVIAS
jgi:CRISPR type IV-associated protein Csf3